MCAPAEMPPREMESFLMRRDMASWRVYVFLSDARFRFLWQLRMLRYPFQGGERVLDAFSPDGF